MYLALMHCCPERFTVIKSYNTKNICFIQETKFMETNIDNE